MRLIFNNTIQTSSSLTATAPIYSAPVPMRDVVPQMVHIYTCYKMQNKKTVNLGDMQKALMTLGLDRSDCFIDVGSGCGKACLFSFLMFPQLGFVRGFETNETDFAVTSRLLEHMVSDANCSALPWKLKYDNIQLMRSMTRDGTKVVQLTCTDIITRKKRFLEFTNGDALKSPYDYQEFKRVGVLMNGIKPQREQVKALNLFFNTLPDETRVLALDEGNDCGFSQQQMEGSGTVYIPSGSVSLKGMRNNGGRWNETYLSTFKLYEVLPHYLFEG